jgi:predicted DNA-binding protein
MPTNKRSTSFRLSEDARQKLETISVHLGISQTDVVEMIIRHHYKRLMGHSFDSALEQARLRLMVKEDQKGRKKK